MWQLMLISRISGTPLAVKVNEIYKEFNQGDNMADQGLRDVTASIIFFVSISMENHLHVQDALVWWAAERAVVKRIIGNDCELSREN